MEFKTYWQKHNLPLIILHWWGGSWQSWDNIAKILWEDFYVIVPDIPSASKTATCEKAYNLDDYVELVKNLADKLGLNKFVLFWHSNGGAIATKFTVKYPQYVEKLILNNSAGIRNDKKRTFKRKIFGIISKPAKWLFMLPYMSRFKKFFYKAIWAQDYLQTQKNPCKKETFLNMIKEDLQEVFPQIKADTLLIRWENDTYTPLSDWKKIHSLIKNSKLVVIPNVRHWIHFQNPQKLIEVIREFIS